MSEIIFDVAPDLKTVTIMAPNYGGAVHGNDKSGAVDVEFPTVWEASTFAQSMMNAFGWEMDIRSGDSVTSLHSPVVLTIGPGYVPRVEMY